MKQIKSESIRLLVSPAEKAAFQKAADATGLTLSAWIRFLALKAATIRNETLGPNVSNRGRKTG